MRIVLGSVEIGGMIPVFADGFRQLGHQVTTFLKEKHAFFSDFQYDVDISEVIRWPEPISKTKSPAVVSLRKNVGRAAILTRLMPLVMRHDVFFFLWAGTSLTEANREFPILKKLGKRMISVFCGSDVRHLSSYSQQFADLISEESFMNPRNTRQDLVEDPISRPLKNMRMAERYSDLIVSAPINSALAVRPYNHVFVPINLSEYKPNIPGREIPIIIHAPSDTGVKGTKPILSALDKIKADNIPFELRFLHGVPHRQVVTELENADVVVDQLDYPLHGVLGVEAMASGCALASGNREEEKFEPFPPNRPIWHIEQGNVYSQLKRLLTDRELRIRLAREGRKHVERYHDHVGVARRILEGLDAGDNQTFDHYPTFFAESYFLPDGVVIPEGLKRMTAEIVQRWGLPEYVDPQEMIRRGLMSPSGLSASQPIPRWNLPSESTIKSRRRVQIQ